MFQIDGLATSVGVTPNLSRAQELRRGMDLRLLKSLRSILERILERSNIDCRSALDGVKRVREGIENGTHQKLSFLAYSLHWSLKRVIASKDYDRLLSLVDQLARSVLTEEEIRIFSLRHSSVDPSEALLTDVLASAHKETYKTDLQLSEPLPDEVQASRDEIARVLMRIAEVDPATHAEIASLVSEIALIKEPHLNAGSCFRMYGCIYVHVLRPEQTWIRFLEHLTHETAHHWLFGVWTLDPILTGPDSDCFQSPLRNEPRPMSAIFHQMFVLARVLRIWSVFQKIGRCGPEIYKGYTHYQNDRDGKNFTEKFWLAADLVEKHASLTPVGAAILSGCQELVVEYPVQYDA